MLLQNGIRKNVRNSSLHTRQVFMMWCCIVFFGNNRVVCGKYGLNHTITLRQINFTDFPCHLCYVDQIKTIKLFINNLQFTIPERPHTGISGKFKSVTQMSDIVLGELAEPLI